MFLLKVKRSLRLRIQLPIRDVTMCTAPTSTSATWGVLHLGALVTECTNVTMDESKMARRQLLTFVNSNSYVANNYCHNNYQCSFYLHF